MPSKQRTTHRPRSSKRADQAEEIELAPIHLEVKGHVSPTWEIGAEPDAYITDLASDILLPKADADDEIRVGTISAYSVHLGEALED